MTEPDLFPISSFISPPLPLSGSAAEPLGPLLFTPSPQSLTLLWSSHSLSPPFDPLPRLSTQRFIETSADDAYVPTSVSSLIAADINSHSDDTPPIVSNSLQLLRCPNDDVLVFFPIGENYERVGFVVLSVKDSDRKVKVHKDGDAFTSTNTGFSHRIHKFFVTPVADSGWGSSPSTSLTGNSVLIGYLLASTLYSVHWYSVEIGKFGSNLEEPALVYLGTKTFKSCSVVHVCWSPHLSEESVVLLKNGGLFLFDLGPCLRAHSLRGKLKGTRIRFQWDSVDISEKGEWVGCDFSWHPRILIVACSNAVFLVDWRYGESNVSILAKLEMFYMNNSIERERFIVFSKADLDGYYFAVATECWLFLYDVRNPLMPVLQWVHGLDNPCYMNTYRLSELRSQSKDDSESGSAIVLGSFWNCEFGLFCYGPPLQAPTSSVASKISKYCNTLYAWELPSELSLSGRDCNSGDCLVKEEFWKESLPVWIRWQQKKEIVLGFDILEKYVSGSQMESGSSCGFTLIRLMSSGKLESQEYHASWDHAKKLEKAGEEVLFQFKDSLIYSSGDQEYNFPKRFKYLKLDYLYGYLNGNLAQVMTSKMQNSHTDIGKRKSSIQDFGEVICEKLKVCGVEHTGSSPLIADVFKDIGLPTSIYEIALKRLWTGLPMDILNLAFSNNLELLEILVDQKKVSLEFLDVPDIVQLPPFLVRKPSGRSNKWTPKVKPGSTLAGPVLPLPILLNLRKIHEEKSCFLSEEKADAETEVINECNEVLKVANEIGISGSCTELHESHAVSLGNDKEENWSGSQEQKPVFIYHAQAFSDVKSSSVELTQDACVFRDERFDSFVCKMREKEHVKNSRKEPVGLEVFDELCPIELKFDSPAENFEMKELKSYKLLKRQFSKWQEGFKPYQDFCTQYKIRK